MHASAVIELDRPSDRARGSARAPRPSPWPAPTTVGESFRQAVERFGERPALVVRRQGVRASYLRLWNDADRVARTFLALGVERRAGIGIWSSGRYECVVTLLAAARVGATVVVIDPACGAEELALELRESGVSILMLEQERNVSVLADALPGCPQLERTIVFERDWQRFLHRGFAIRDARLAARERRVRPDDAVVTGQAPFGTLLQRDILDPAPRASASVDEERIALLLGSLVSPAHGGCMVV